MGTESKLKSVKSAEELLNLYYYDMRSALLEVASALDRIERAENGAELLKSDYRLKRFFEACDIIKNGSVNRAKQFQELHSTIKL